MKIKIEKWIETNKSPHRKKYDNVGVGSSRKSTTKLETVVKTLLFTAINTWLISNVVKDVKKSGLKTLLWKIPLALLAADLAGYITHMYFDMSTVKGSNTIIDKARDAFKKHHDNPTDYLDASTYDLLIVFVAFQLAVSLGIALVPDGQTKSVLSLAAITVPLQQIVHKYAHCRTHDKYVPKWIRWLQDHNILLSGPEHRKHHMQKDNVGNWSIFTPLSNRVGNAIVQPLFKSKFL